MNSVRDVKDDLVSGLKMSRVDGSENAEKAAQQKREARLCLRIEMEMNGVAEPTFSEEERNKEAEKQRRQYLKLQLYIASIEESW